MSSGISFSSEGKADGTGAVTTNVDLSEMIFGEEAVIKWPDPVHSQPDDKVVYFKLIDYLYSYNAIF